MRSELADADMRWLQQAMRSRGRRGLEFCSRCAGHEVSTQSAALIASSAVFVSAVLGSMSISPAAIDEISIRALSYLRYFDVNPSTVAEEHNAYGSAQMAAA
jgi:hypothetical protein